MPKLTPRADAGVNGAPAFIALLFVKGIGLWLYIALDLAMPMHPDDRRHLLRLKLRRAWQRRFAHANDDAR